MAATKGTSGRPASACPTSASLAGTTDIHKRAGERMPNGFGVEIHVEGEDA